jgi:hypothetical protein
LGLTRLFHRSKKADICGEKGCKAILWCRETGTNGGGLVASPKFTKKFKIPLILWNFSNKSHFETVIATPTKMKMLHLGPPKHLILYCSCCQSHTVQVRSFCCTYLSSFLMHILCKEVSSDCKILEVSIVRGGVGEIGSLVVKKRWRMGWVWSC